MLLGYSLSLDLTKEAIEFDETIMFYHSMMMRRERPVSASMLLTTLITSFCLNRMIVPSSLIHYTSRFEASLQLMSRIVKFTFIFVAMAQV